VAVGGEAAGEEVVHQPRLDLPVLGDQRLRLLDRFVHRREDLGDAALSRQAWRRHGHRSEILRANREERGSLAPTMQERKVLFDGVEKEHVIGDTRSGQDRSQTTTDAIVLVSAVGCANRSADADQRRACLGNTKGWGTVESWMWIARPKLGTALEKRQSVFCFIHGCRFR